MILLRKYVSVGGKARNSGIIQKKAIAFVLILACAFLCSPDDAYADNIPVTGIGFDIAELNLEQGGTYQVGVTIVPANATNQNVIWESTDNSIAVVENGLVTGIREGTAIIRGYTEDGGYSDGFYVYVTAIEPVSANSIVRVKLSMNDPTLIPIYIDGAYSVAEKPSLSLERQFYKIRVSGGSLKLYYGDSVLYMGDTITLRNHAVEDGQNNFLYFEHPLYGTRRYLGDMVFTYNSGTIQVVNHVYLEEYLYGVVPYEMSNSFPIESLKTQAVAARTFVVKNSGSNPVGDTSAFQVYKGYHPANNNAVAAVSATEGEVLQWSATELAQTYYSASNGGYTEIPYHVWGGGYYWPFYIKEDPYDRANPYSPYEEIFVPLTINANNPITSKDNVTGTPNISNLVKYFKTEILNSGKLQNFGYNPSSIDDFDFTGLLTITPHTHDAGGSEDHSRMPNNGVNECPDYIRATATFKIRPTGSNDEMVIPDVELNLQYLDASNDIQTYKVFNFSSLRLTLCEPTYEAGVLTGYTISQRRYGHGIGMSQRGAQQRAYDGQVYEQILAFYYPESAPCKVDIQKPAQTTISQPDNSNATVTASDYLSVRASASTSSELIFKLPAGARIQVVQENYNSSFHKIRFGGENYFVHSSYVNVDLPFPMEGVAFTGTSFYVSQGLSRTLEYVFAPENPSNPNVSFTSSNTAVATVNSAGKVTANAAGFTDIHIITEDGGFTDGIRVYVYDCDIDNDGDVDLADIALLAQNFNSTNSAYDVNSDGVCNMYDLIIVGRCVG